MQILKIKADPAFRVLLSDENFGVISETVSQPPVEKELSKADEQDPWNTTSVPPVGKRKREDAHDSRKTFFEKFRENEEEAIEWIKTYKKVEEFFKTPEWKTMLIKEFGGKEPKILNMSLADLKVTLERIYTVLNLRHPFDVQWNFMGMGVAFAEQMSVRAGLFELTGATNAIMNDRELYLEAKKLSLKYFDFSINSGYLHVANRLYGDIAEVYQKNSIRRKQTKAMLSLPASDEILKIANS